MTHALYEGPEVRGCPPFISLQLQPSMLPRRWCCPSNHKHLCNRIKKSNYKHREQTFLGADSDNREVHHKREEKSRLQALGSSQGPTHLTFRMSLCSKNYGPTFYNEKRAQSAEGTQAPRLVHEVGLGVRTEVVETHSGASGRVDREHHPGKWDGQKMKAFELSHQLRVNPGSPTC